MPKTPPRLPGPGSRRRLPLLLAILILLAAGVAFPGIARVLTDWWWFREVGYGVIFTRELTTRSWLFLGAGGFATLFLLLNIRLSQRGMLPDGIAFQLGPQGPRLNATSLVRKLAWPLAILVGLLVGAVVASAWAEILRAFYRTPFGVTDPVFHRDVAYYVFILPVLSGGLALLSTLTVLALLFVTPIHLLRREIRLVGRRVHVEPLAAAHLAALLATFFLLVALRIRFVAIPGLLYDATGPLFGAGYTDVHARLPMLRLSALMALVAGALVVVGIWRQRALRFGAVAVALYFVVSVLGRGVYPALIQKFVVAPTELTRERPYLVNHIAATRRAWDLDSVEVSELPDAGGLTEADIRANRATIENVRLWDRDPLLETFGQLQEIRTYYDFLSVDDDRYLINDTLRQVLLSPRELAARSLPTRTFINEHLTFTHGMGLTLGPVNEVTTEGLPVLFIKDLPPSSSTSLTITRPQIYYGEEQYGFALTGTRQREFDHPAGEENIYRPYTGKGGVSIGGVFRRLAFAVAFQSSKLFFSQDLTDSSRILYYRNIVDRARRALPFLVFDRDPYLVIDGDGTLKWMLDAYTTTSRYPYAQPVADGTNYQRNSVKLVIDAYDGSLTAYVSAPADPLIRTWERIFPGIFQPLARMPATLLAHRRYPDDLYRRQARLYTTYHMVAPEDFYHREDQWQIPEVDEANSAVPFMRHLVMQLPEESHAEFIYMIPFTPRGKDNLSAWMVARNDGPEYGKLRVYQLPRQSLVFGPRQIESRINQDTEISRQVSLWDQRGSAVIRGDLLVIPIKKSLLYVQPLYLQAKDGRIPELKRVIVAYENQVVMAQTLDEALGEMFGAGAATGAGTTVSRSAESSTEGGAQAELLTEARRHYQNAMDAQRQGDWSRYGDEIRALGEVLGRLAPGGQ